MQGSWAQKSGERLEAQTQEGEEKPLFDGGLPMSPG